MDAGILRKLSAVFKKKNKKKKAESLHSPFPAPLLHRARILPSYSHSDPGIYFKVRFGKKAASQLFQRSAEMMGFNFTASGYKARKSVRFLREFSSVNEKMFY